MEQNKQTIEISKCPICGHNEFSMYLKTKDFFFTQEEFSLTKCKNCNLVFTNPIPHNLSIYYDTPDYLSHNTSDSGLMGRLYSTLRNINIKRKYNLVTKYCKQGAILDIGCGTGELLNYFKNKNWTTVGIEPNNSARGYAKTKHGIEVFNENELKQLLPDSFDAISMWHVLEHVPDLHGRISQVSKLLKRDGTIFIALPNLSSPDSVKYKEYWSALDVPRHLYHFTKETFVELISQHKMKLIHAEPMKFDSYYVSMLSEKYLENKLYLPVAIKNGYLSNQKAKKENNYSSMIFVVKKI